MTLCKILFSDKITFSQSWQNIGGQSKENGVKMEGKEMENGKKIELEEVRNAIDQKELVNLRKDIDKKEVEYLNTCCLLLMTQYL